MTRRQMVLMIAVNAVVSALITLLLVLVILPALGAPVPVQGVATAASGPMAGQVVETAVQPQSSPTPLIHVVEAGDTISYLSQKYDVPAEDIIAANQIQNPNYLQLGTELMIPVGGLSEATPTLTPVPTATETPIPFEPPSSLTATAAAAALITATAPPSDFPSGGELQVEISEIMAPGDVTMERVILANIGERLADMQGWTLSDAHGNVYTFANFRLWTGGSAIVHTRVGQDGNPPANFYWGEQEALWAPGDVATLKDREGQVLDTYTVP